MSKRRRILDGSQLEPITASSAFSTGRNPLKNAVEDDEGVLDILPLLFRLLSADEPNLNCMLEVACAG
jgi:hypothetical protein